MDRSVLARLPRAAANVGSSNERSDVKVGLLNIRSLTDTETWQQPNDFSQLNEAITPGFVYTGHPRLTGRGGGLAIIYSETWKVSPVTATAYSSFNPWFFN